MAKPKKKKTHKETQSKEELYQSCPRAGLFRRLGAYLYDLFAVVSLLILATLLAILVVIIGNYFNIINISAYKDVADYLANNLLFAAYLAAVIIAFYGYFWSKAGQTVGMKAWRLRVQNSDGSNISFTQSLIRMATSAFGLGNFLALFQERNAFQDLWAECEVVVLPKELNSGKGLVGKVQNKN